jgi:hypothetical protein
MRPARARTRIAHVERHLYILRRIIGKLQAMDKKQWEQIANTYLDQCDIQDECATEVHDAHCEPTQFYQDILEEMKERYEHAKIAFPGITFNDYMDHYDLRNSPKKKRGGQPQDPLTKASEPKWRAVRDADRLREYWKSLNPDRPRPTPPLPPEEIAAKRHIAPDNQAFVDTDPVITAARRPASRRWDKKASR